MTYKIRYKLLENDPRQLRSQGGLRVLEHPPLRLSEYAMNGSGQQAATA